MRWGDLPPVTGSYKGTNATSASDGDGSVVGYGYQCRPPPCAHLTVRLRCSCSYDTCTHVCVRLPVR